MSGEESPSCAQGAFQMGLNIPNRHATRIQADDHVRQPTDPALPLQHQPRLEAAQPVHIVCDNYATHKTDMINNWLGRHPRFHVHFTPTGSSWVNQVERFFGLITDKLIRRGVHTSIAALEADIRQWIDTWNDNPRPFTWTKTADEILNSLAKYLARISGATH